MKKLLITLAVVAVIGVIVYSQRATIATRVMERGLETRLGGDVIDTFEDGLYLTLCGAGGPMPAPNASGPCVAVVAGKSLFVVDAGTDGVRNLARMGFQAGSIKGVFLTHFHSDHIDGLGEMATLRWAGGGNKSPLPVYGAHGVSNVTNGLNQAYAQDFTYRHEHHGDLVADMKGAGLEARPFDKPAIGELLPVLEEGGLKVEALVVQHSPVDPAVGYKFTYKGRTIVVTGDTAKSDNITNLSKGVDLLVHEALAHNLVNMMEDAAKEMGSAVMEKVFFDIPDYHASPVEAAETARDAGVGHLLYYHIVPPLIFPGQETLYLNGAEDIFPDYTVGQDGIGFYLPPNSSEIIENNLSL